MVLEKLETEEAHSHRVVIESLPAIPMMMWSVRVTRDSNVSGRRNSKKEQVTFEFLGWGESPRDEGLVK